jgi:type IV secretion system protein VirB2
VALAVQQSLFQANGRSPIVESARWIEAVLLGDLALGLCAIAVAAIGITMLTGRLPYREGIRVVIGCFILLSAPVIAAGIVEGAGRFAEAPTPVLMPAENPRPDLPPANYDPYAGASLRKDKQR